MKMTLRTQKLIIPYIFILPAIGLFLVFLVYPLLKGFQISFFNWSIMPNRPSTFVGLDNYVRAFGDPVVWVAFKNTVIYTFTTVPIQMILSMLAACLLYTSPSPRD